MLHLQQLDNLPRSVIPEINRVVQSHCQEVLGTPVYEIQIYNLKEQCSHTPCLPREPCPSPPLEQQLCVHECVHTHTSKGQPSGCHYAQLVGSGTLLQVIYTVA